MVGENNKVTCFSLLLLLFVGSCSAAAAETHTSPRWLVPRTNITGPNPNDYQCQSARAPDYYGIGVRLGIYFSWFTGWVANSFVPGDIGGALDTNAIFLFANLVAMVRCTITKVLTQLDCVILMHLSGGTVFSVLSLWGYRTCHYLGEGPKGIRHFGGFGTHLRLVLSMAVAVYGPWFWWFGIVPETTAVMIDAGPCRTVYTFMFAKVRADGGVRIFNIIVCIGCVIYFGVMLLASFLALFARFAKGVDLAKQGKWRTSTRLHYATGLYQKELRRIFYFLGIGNFLWILWSMILVECTLNFNHVKEVLGPGNRIFFPSQLIPLIIGCFSFVRLGYKVLEKWRDPEDEPSLPTEPHHSQTHQDFPGPRKLFEVFAPPTKFVSTGPQVPEDIPPEDTDIDELVQGELVRVRYIVTWLPWLSLPHRWTNDEQRRQNSHKCDAHLEKGRSHPPTSTLQGSPTAPTFVNPYEPQIP
ncbi:uncharacterized protein Z519_09861 [Cladophialophora bantiana CBS 173.52]|uniref:G-protein coupled receptors family 2 profile 2 domain-containing protein n=1 Tax=Cladophialophora bantiana (strain ATCC 10958 / CBS 173.52 / CDC B-1940 / NIH 8579) TaxID=1442370 RepID=A0A0D2HFY4_CLAB1|nr:uncharacterized protein Z519_09861 [Cladophialophora bantiana CBS 173.52]KIW89705.1 hypothetical protein Z519_09861 [Cladophialophora bantiana CBS 173.52]